MLPDSYFFDNLQDFIQKSNILPKSSDTCIIILNYNNKNFILRLAALLEKVDCDVVIVDNHSDDGSYEALVKRYADRFNLIETKENMGGAGGFGLGIQWVIEREYRYCFVSEEDALPLDGNEDIFHEMLRHRTKDSFVVARYYELDTTSFNLHYHIYPVAILKHVGTLNKDLFFRADDQEWGMRIRKYLQKHNIAMQTKVVDRYYTHPLIKRGFGLFANYFGMRNAFFVYLKYPNRNFAIDYFQNFVKYCTYALFTFVHDANSYPLKQFFYAFKDFLFDDLTKNKKRIEQFRGFTLEPSRYSLQTLSFDAFYEAYKDYKPISATFFNKHFEKYRFASHAQRGVIASKFSGVARIKAFLYKRIVFVEEVDFLQKTITFFEYENPSPLRSKILLFVSASVAASAALLFFPIIVMKKLEIIR